MPWFREDDLDRLLDPDGTIGLEIDVRMKILDEKCFGPSQTGQTAQQNSEQCSHYRNGRPDR